MSLDYHMPNGNCGMPDGSSMPNWHCEIIGYVSRANRHYGMPKTALAQAFAREAGIAGDAASIPQRWIGAGPAFEYAAAKRKKPGNVDHGRYIIDDGTMSESDLEKLPPEKRSEFIDKFFKKVLKLHQKSKKKGGKK